MRKLNYIKNYMYFIVFKRVKLWCIIRACTIIIYYGCALWFWSHYVTLLWHTKCNTNVYDMRYFINIYNIFAWIAPEKIIARKYEYTSSIFLLFTKCFYFNILMWDYTRASVNEYFSFQRQLLSFRVSFYNK